MVTEASRIRGILDIAQQNLRDLLPDDIGDSILAAGHPSTSTNLDLPTHDVGVLDRSSAVSRRPLEEPFEASLGSLDHGDRELGALMQIVEVGLGYRDAKSVVQAIDQTFDAPAASP